MEILNDGQKNDRTIEKSKKNQSFHRSIVLIIRPWLHCPEIDSYDKITVKQVIGTFKKGNELMIGDKIIYTI